MEGERDLAAREVAVRTRENRVEELESLARKGLPGELGELLNYDDREKCLMGVETLDKVFRREVAQQVDRFLSGRGVKLTGAESKSEDEMSDREYYLRMTKNHR